MHVNCVHHSVGRTRSNAVNVKHDVLTNTALLSTCVCEHVNYVSCLVTELNVRFKSVYKSVADEKTESFSRDLLFQTEPQ